jgi:hypothetical protein
MKWLNLLNDKLNITFLEDDEQWEILLNDDDADVELIMYLDNATKEVVKASIVWISKNYFYCWKKDRRDFTLSKDFVYLDVFSDFLEKAKFILKKDDTFDKRILMELECSSEEYLQISKAAAYEGISIDEFMEKVMIEMINKKS